MAVNVGDILFTSLITDSDPGGNVDAFSIVATTNISAGETITFHAPEAGGDSSFTFTVGATGLQLGDFVRISVPNTGTPTILEDPSGGSVGAISGLSWSMTGSDNLIASDGTNALAGITNSAGDGSSWDDNFGLTGLSRVNLDNYNATGDPITVFNLPGTTTDDNSMWVGGAFNTIDDTGFSNWNIQNDTTISHSAPTIGGATYTSQDAATPCFAPGTMIATDTGDVAVETLQIGDVLRTADGRLVPVKWIGRFTAHKLRCGLGMEPVRIRAGALGDGLPMADLIVTANHGMILDGLVINASALVNGNTIDFVPLAALPTRVVYYHIETENHDVILANGAPSETYVDIPSRMGFDNCQEYLDLYGAERIIPEMDRLRISSRRLVPDAIKARLGIVNEGIEFDLPLTA